MACPSAGAAPTLIATNSPTSDGTNEKRLAPPNNLCIVVASLNWLYGRRRHDPPRRCDRRFIGPQASLDDLLSELNLIRELLTTGTELSDIQLFSQLKNLSEIKAALTAMPSDTASRMLREVDQLLETVFASSKFGL